MIVLSSGIPSSDKRALPALVFRGLPDFLAASRGPAYPFTQFLINTVFRDKWLLEALTQYAIDIDELGVHGNVINAYPSISRYGFFKYVVVYVLLWHLDFE